MFLWISTSPALWLFTLFIYIAWTIFLVTWGVIILYLFCFMTDWLTGCVSLYQPEGVSETTEVDQLAQSLQSLLRKQHPHKVRGQDIFIPRHPNPKTFFREKPAVSCLSRFEPFNLVTTKWLLPFRGLWKYHVRTTNGYVITTPVSLVTLAGWKRFDLGPTTIKRDNVWHHLCSESWRTWLEFDQASLRLSSFFHTQEREAWGRGYLKHYVVYLSSIGSCMPLAAFGGSMSPWFCTVSDLSIIEAQCFWVRGYKLDIAGIQWKTERFGPELFFSWTEAIGLWIETSCLLLNSCFVKEFDRILL